MMTEQTQRFLSPAVMTYPFLLKARRINNHELEYELRFDSQSFSMVSDAWSVK